MSAQVISFHCILKNRTGQVLSSTFNRDILTETENNEALLKGLSQGLKDLKKGERRTISLSAQEAYGFYEPSKVILFPKKNLGREVRVGETISIVGKSGTTRVYRVIQLHQDMVTLDGNHPLAGQDLIFEIETVDVREATAEDLIDSTSRVGEQVFH